MNEIAKKEVSHPSEISNISFVIFKLKVLDYEVTFSKSIEVESKSLILNFEVNSFEFYDDF